MGGQEMRKVVLLFVIALMLGASTKRIDGYIDQTIQDPAPVREQNIT